MSGFFGDLFDDAFGEYKNPSTGAMDYLKNVPDELKQYLTPYINTGNNANSQLPDAYKNMMNPNALIGKIGSGYSASPGYQWQLNQGLNAANNAASAGGMIGTPQHQQQSATVAEGLANQDYYNYLGKALNLYGSGVQGLQDQSHQGFEGARDLSQGLAQNDINHANFSYAGDAGQNMHDQGNQGAFFGFLSSLIGAGANGAKSAAMAGG